MNAQIKNLEEKVFSSSLRIRGKCSENSSKTFDKEKFISVSKDLQKILEKRDSDANSSSE